MLNISKKVNQVPSFINDHPSCRQLPLPNQVLTRTSWRGCFALLQLNNPGAASGGCALRERALHSGWRNHPPYQTASGHPATSLYYTEYSEVRPREGLKAGNRPRTTLQATCDALYTALTMRFTILLLPMDTRNLLSLLIFGFSHVQRSEIENWKYASELARCIGDARSAIRHGLVQCSMLRLQPYRYPVHFSKSNAARNFACIRERTELTRN
jgi:hypothetical protein